MASLKEYHHKSPIHLGQQNTTSVNDENNMMSKTNTNMRIFLLTFLRTKWLQKYICCIILSQNFIQHISYEQKDHQSHGSYD